MQSSRDSSVWRSLAVAFGDGLAFGVGMKLTQPSGRASTAAPATEPDLTPLSQRLEQMEQRIREIETRPRPPAAVEKPSPPGQPFDKQVLEAVVNALDARVRENSSQLERRILELQAKITIELKTLHGQDRSLGDGMKAMIAEACGQSDEHSALRLGDLEEQFRAQLERIRHAAEADRHSMREYLANLRKDVAGLVTSGAQASAAEVKDQLTGEVAVLRDEIREELRQATSRMAVMAASAADAALENRLAPLRATLEARDREIAGLRARLAGSDQATLDLLQGVGEICRRAAQRIVAANEAPSAENPLAEVEPATAAPGSMDAALETEFSEGVPGFAQSTAPGKLWRVPLVSSFVLTSGVMLMRHFL